MDTIFLKQPRRGKTREAQITPHKRSAVWGQTSKRSAMWGLLILAVTFLVGCNGDKLSFVGDYSYKLSGEVELKASDGEVSYRLLHRNGQMNILKDKSQKNRYIITMNELNGGCYTMTAELRGDSLLLDTHEFVTNVLSTNSLPSLNGDEDLSLVYRVSASGGGTVNDGVLMLRESWTGSLSGEPSSTLRGPEMTIIAEKN